MEDCNDIKGRVIRLEESKYFTDEQLAQLMQRFIIHMDKEEEAFNKLYNRLRAIEKEIQQSFTQRDDAIHTLDKKIVRIIAWATASFVVISLVIQSIAKLIQ